MDTTKFLACVSVVSALHQALLYQDSDLESQISRSTAVVKILSSWHPNPEALISAIRDDSNFDPIAFAARATQISTSVFAVISAIGTIHEVKARTTVASYIENKDFRDTTLPSPYADVEHLRSALHRLAPQYISLDPGVAGSF